MKDNRKKWIPPQLIVLGRGTPEENVLARLQDIDADRYSSYENKLQEKSRRNLRLNPVQYHFQNVLGSLSSIPDRDGGCGPPCQPTASWFYPEGDIHHILGTKRLCAAAIPCPEEGSFQVIILG